MKRYISGFLLMLLLAGCDVDFLDKKPDKALVVPTELSHFQALLDAVPDGMNTSTGLGVIASDDFYTLDQSVQTLPVTERNTYLWAADVFEGKASTDWETPYKGMFYANIVLDGLAGMDEKTKASKEWGNVRGQALFFRAFASYNLVSLFAAAYDPSSAGAIPGIPIRLTSDVNQIVGRGTLQQSYDQILSDLSQAALVLDQTTAYTNRPSGVAVQALLARIYLSMQKYENAMAAADAALNLQSGLLDYNTLTPTARRPFPVMFSGLNPEIIFHASMPGMDFPILTTTGVDSLLYKSYQDNDLRKSCFYTDRGAGVFGFKGSYLGSATLFSGLATDELYLIRAECNARLGNVELVLEDLNKLLASRYKTGTFVPYLVAEDIVELVLTERRKELVARGLRWSDLKRFNLQSANARTLKRHVNGVDYELAAGSNRYVFPIPDNEISLSGISQNPR